MNLNQVFQERFGEFASPASKFYKTDGMKSPRVFCADKICKKISWSEKSCDEIVLSAAANGRTGVHCVEIKGGMPRNLDASEIAEQLQGGANIVERHLGDEEKFHFLPVLAAPRGIPETVRKELGRKKVLLRDIPAKRFTPSPAKGENLPQFPSR